MGSHLKASERLFSYIKSKEKFTSPARVLPGDRPDVVTGGYGQIGLRIGQIVTEAEAEGWLRAKVQAIGNAVNSAVKAALNHNQFDSITSLTYNIGVSAFLDSTLLRRLNSGAISLAANEFTKWVRANGKILPGLVTRRKEEQAWFLEK